MKSVIIRVSSVLLFFSFSHLYAADPQQDSEPTELLDEESENDTTETLNNSLSEAIMQGDSGAVRHYIARGADVNAKFGNRGDTPLTLAVSCLHVLTSYYEQKIFSDPHTFNIAYTNRLAIIRFLVFHPDVDMAARNNLGETALLISTQEGLNQVTELLLNNIHISTLTEQLDNVGDYKEKLDALDIPQDTRDKIEEAIEKSANMSGPHEVGRQAEYLKFIFSLPWDKKTELVESLPDIENALEEHHYGLKKVKDKILEFISMCLLTPKAKTKILCLVGPPGTGKTSIAQSIAKGLGRKYAKISLGGVHEERAIKGHNKAYVGAEPGDVLKALKTAESKNPVLLLDEIDKLGTQNQWSGNPAAALLEVLDPEQNSKFVDHYLDIPFDLSEVLFITTANNHRDIPRPLLDRMEVVELSSYTHDEKFHIGKKYLIPKALAASGLAEKGLVISDDLLHAIIRGFTYESGVRKLEEVLKTLCGKAARLLLEKGTIPSFTPENLAEYLGASRDHLTEQEFIKQNSIGVSNGLFWNSVEGGMAFVETTLMPGDGKLKLTGNLGNSIKESAEVALSYARSHTKELGIDPALFKQSDLHIHTIPSSGIDGPSAGITILSSIVSCLSKKPFNKSYAMTGELSLTGRVLPIGGLKEKLLAAKQNGVHTVIVPKGNNSDLIELKDITHDMEIIVVSYAQEVLEKVLLPSN